MPHTCERVQQRTVAHGVPLPGPEAVKGPTPPHHGPSLLGSHCPVFHMPELFVIEPRDISSSQPFGYVDIAPTLPRELAWQVVTLGAANDRTA